MKVQLPPVLLFTFQKPSSFLFENEFQKIQAAAGLKELKKVPVFPGCQNIVCFGL